ncbi:putative PGR5-like protein [Skeletonema marinoi]|uniref:PGR5-like protein n=1 Tax=Skeletonema marinoi TaxID=267567 RepID=A0AAD8YLV5_9STRA|nr:putative PGR5-like protein [Skeletonema marinoi]
MNRFVSLCLIVVALVASSVQGFAPSSLGGISGGSNFVVSQRSRAQQPVSRSNSKSSLQMGSQAKFGIFSPAVYGAKIALGADKLNKVRGKAISLHSQYIGEFCEWAGAYHLRTRLIKKAKTNGDILGFLV